ncbi:MAG TPA: hypothetical protein VNO79_05970 [Actinomycetota bacterium]|nr:hypothetical protein [Actinomycetota bacterium]
MGKDTGEALEEYEASGRYNVLHPVVKVSAEAASPYLVPSISVVQIRPDPDAGEVYHDYRFAPPPREQGGRRLPGKYALTALGLQRIANAAGVEIVDSRPIGQRQRDPATGHVHVDWQVVAAVRQPNGEVIRVPGTASVDTADFADEREQAYLEQIRTGRNLDQRTGKPRFTEADVPEMVRRDVIAVKAKLEERAETLAMNRAIRKILSLKQVYTEEEIARPFVVPRLLYRPEVVDAARAAIEGRRAAAELYGELPVSSTSGSAPQGSPSPADTSPPGPGEAGGEATGAAGATVTGGTTTDPNRSEAPAAPGPPKDDPIFPDGPHQGKHWSEVAHDHPDYIRAIATESRSKVKRELAKAWLEYYYPKIVGGMG